MSPQQEPCEIVCQVCEKKVVVNFRNQKDKYCPKCKRKVFAKVEAELREGGDHHARATNA